MKDAIVIIPTYNEIENIEAILRAVFGLEKSFDVLVVEYDTSIWAIHPQTEEVITDSYRTLEVLEIENGKVSVIRKYSE